MGIEDLQRFVTNDLLVFREEYLSGLQKFRYRGSNAILGNIEEERYRAESFDILEGYKFGGILGGAQPSDYSASIELWNNYFNLAGQRAVFFGFDITPEQDGNGRIAVNQPKVVEFLRAALKQNGIFDITITDPYKGVALEYLLSINAVVADNARDIGVVNHVVKGDDGKVYGLNTDGRGMVRSIQERRNLGDSKVLVIGAGGSASAITYELLRAGLSKLVILNRTESKALDLAERWQKIYGGHITVGGLPSIDDHLEGADVILQAVTQGGMTEEQAKKTKDDALFVDTRYGDKAAFVTLGKKVGRDTEDGKGMLYWQFVEALTDVEEKVFGTEINTGKLEKVKSGFGYGQ